MAHIVCITGGLRGLFNASLELVARLQRAGHRVTYASPHALGEAVRAAGLSYVQLDPWMPRPAEPDRSPWIGRFLALSRRRHAAAARLGADGFAKTIGDLKPDLVLIDIEMHPHIMQGLRAGLPMALLCPFQSLWHRPGVPPMSSRVVPGRGLMGSGPGLRLTWLMNGIGMRLAVARHWLTTAGLDQRSILRRYADHVGVPFRAQYGLHQWLVPWKMPDLPVICLHGAEFDYPHQRHPLMHYVGPMVCEDRPEPTVPPEDLSRLERVYARRGAEGRRLIYCGFSTFVSRDPDHLDKLCDVARQRPDWDFVIGQGGLAGHTGRKDVPGNVHLFEYAPQLQVLVHADAAVTDGGCNTIDECVHFGVPMLSYSLGHACQNGSAARVGYHGLGRVGDRRRDGPEEMLASLEALITQPSFRTNLARFQSFDAAYNDENHAARIVESLITP